MDLIVTPESQPVSGYLHFVLVSHWVFLTLTV